MSELGRIGVICDQCGEDCGDSFLMIGDVRKCAKCSGLTMTATVNTESVSIPVEIVEIDTSADTEVK